MFGCANLAAFIFAPIFGRVGHKIGAKLLYNFGAYLQALSAIALGLLYYIEDVNLFIGLSYMLRIFGGIADAAAWSAVLGILMSLFPSKVARIISFTQVRKILRVAYRQYILNNSIHRCFSAWAT